MFTIVHVLIVAMTIGDGKKHISKIPCTFTRTIIPTELAVYNY